MKRNLICFLLALLVCMLGCTGAAMDEQPAASVQTERIVLHEDGNHTFTDNICTECGYVDMSDMNAENALRAYGYYHTDADGSHTVNMNDTILFGSYPQGTVTENTDALSAFLTDAWTDYGYYANGEVAALMFYQDVEYNGDRYRAVRIDGNKPYYIDLSATEENSYVFQNGYTAGNVYFFRFEPIEWRVLDFANGEALLQSVKCLDGQSFSGAYDVQKPMYYNKGTEIFLNDWESSYIRAYLNDTFYNAAFSDAEKGFITMQTLCNSDTSFDPENTFSKSQNDTTDSVYLLSYQDILNPLYGFADVKGGANGSVTVMKTGTDYAKSQGVRTSIQSANENGEPCSWWMLRSAGGKSFSVCGISKTGELTNSKTAEFTTSASDGICTYTAEGIAPAVTIKIGK